MSKKNLRENLEKSLEKLNLTAKKIVDTRGYTQEVKNIKVLEELIREQLINENSNHSTS